MRKNLENGNQTKSVTNIKTNSNVIERKCAEIKFEKSGKQSCRINAIKMY